MNRKITIRQMIFVGLAVILTLSSIVVFVPAFKFQARIRGRLQQAGLLPAELPIYNEPIASAERVSARRLVVISLHDALAAGDYKQAAELNAVLSQEAHQRAYRVLKAWEATRDPATGLLPWALGKHYQEWEVGAIGSNLYSHLLIAAHYLDPDNAVAWEQIIATEYTICGAMPCNIALGSGEVLEGDVDAGIRNASEYTRDGLLAVTERLGDGIWFERMVGAVDALLSTASVDTERGPIPFNSTEVNGSQLQILSRLYWATEEVRYLEMAERIADVYLFDVIPENNGLPSDYWDFTRRSPLPEDARFRPDAEILTDVYPFRLSDHGGEIISGLAELYFLERMLDRPEADEYRQPLMDFLDRIIVTGRTEDGLWVHSVDTTTLEPFDAGLSDNWGYNLCGLLAFDLAEGTQRYSEEIERTMRGAATKHSIGWEGNGADDYADTVESMLYMLPWFDIPEAHLWVDDEIEVMFLKQRDDGFIEGWFLDGNFVRTALLYAQYKTQGTRLDPWAENVRLGAAFDSESNILHIFIAAQGEWKGRLNFDIPRHQVLWGMPLEYPRVNGMPEWYTVSLDKTYTVTYPEDGVSYTYSGQELADGLPVVFQESDAGGLYLLVIEN